MAAGIKMDELLVCWLGSDTVYEDVLTRIETYRVCGPPSLSPKSNNENDDPNDSGKLKHSKSGDSSSSNNSKKNNMNKNTNKNSSNKEDDDGGTNTTGSSSNCIPPFYRPVGTYTKDGIRAPSLRRKRNHNFDQDQSWEGSASDQVVTNNTDNSNTTDNNNSNSNSNSNTADNNNNNNNNNNKTNTSTDSNNPNDDSSILDADLNSIAELNISPSTPLTSTPLPIKEQVLSVFRDSGSQPFSTPYHHDDSLDSDARDILDTDHRYLTVDNFVKITKDVCGLPTFFNGPLYKRILLSWNTRHFTTRRDKVSMWKRYQDEGEDLASVLGVDPPDTDTHDTHDIHATRAEKEKASSSKQRQQKLRQKRIVKAGGDVLVTYRIFRWFWSTEMEDYDLAERFFRLLKRPHRDYIAREDFSPYITELLRDHPGLEFLSDHAEFQDKYAVTVITRIFYSVDRSHSGRITARQIRRSDLLSAFQQVDEEEDINKVARYFSYEHFYVLYCRFWELDHDRDYKIMRDDLSKYGDQCLSHMIVDRIFDAAPRPFDGGGGTGDDDDDDDDKNKNKTDDGKTDKPSREYLTYEDFIFFMLSEEDKSNEVSVRYWFSCLDVDGDGKLNNMEMRSFYALQQHRMQALGQENIPFEDMLCQMIDMIKPKSEDWLVPEDFLQDECHQVSGALFDALFNINKYVQYEQRDPFQERQKREDEFESDWDRFACMDYNRLAMEEEAREEDGMEIDWVTVDDEDEDGDDQGGDQGDRDEQDEEGFSLNGGLGVASEAPF